MTSQEFPNDPPNLDLFDGGTLAEQIRALYTRFPNVQFIPVQNNKTPEVPSGTNWKNVKLTAEQVITRCEKGERVGLVPWSMDCAVIDLDKDKATTAVGDWQDGHIDANPATAYETPSGGQHAYFHLSAPVEQYKWLHDAGSGDTRCDKGYVVVWNMAALCAIKNVSPMSAEEFCRHWPSNPIGSEASVLPEPATGVDQTPLTEIDARLKTLSADVEYDVWYRPVWATLRFAREGHDIRALEKIVHAWSATAPNRYKRQKVADHLEKVSQEGLIGPEWLIAYSDHNGYQPKAAAKKKKKKRKERKADRIKLYGQSLFYPFGPREWGDWYGRLGKASGKIAFLTETEEWFMATATHWRRSNRDQINGFLSEIAPRYEVVGDFLKEAVVRMGLDPEEATHKVGAFVRNGFAGTEFAGGLQHHAARPFPPSPDHHLPTADGIVEVAADGSRITRPFDPKKDHHRAATAAKLGDPKGFEALCRIWFPDPELFDYVRRSLGAALVRDADKSFLALIGQTDSGKSIFVDMMLAALGSMAAKGNERLFDPLGNHNSQICDLIEQQPWLIFLPECQGVSINAKKINELSGRDPLTERRPCARATISGKIRALVALVGEAVPSMRGITAGTVGRQKVIEFSPPEVMDASLEKANHADHPLVESAMAWLVDAACEYRRLGRPEAPPSVVAAGQEALQTQDQLFFHLAGLGEAINGKTAGELAGAFNAISEQEYEVTGNKVSRKLTGMSGLYYKKKMRVNERLGWVYFAKIKGVPHCSSSKAALPLPYKDLEKVPFDLEQCGTTLLSGQKTSDSAASTDPNPPNTEQMCITPHGNAEQMDMTPDVNTEQMSMEQRDEAPVDAFVFWKEEPESEEERAQKEQNVRETAAAIRRIDAGNPLPGDIIRSPAPTAEQLKEWAREATEKRNRASTKKADKVGGTHPSNDANDANDADDANDANVQVRP